MNSFRYVAMFHEEFKDHLATDPSFQQANAGIHITKIAKQYFLQKQIEVLDFLASSIKPNIIENCLSSSSRNHLC